MKAGIINIGDEVLIGHTINTNLSLIANMVADYGISIERQITIRDVEEDIIESIDYMKSLYDYIFISGGLGPTEDDLTAATLAKALNKDMILNEDILYQIQIFFNSIGMKMSPNNKKQAYFPEGAKIIHNDYGTASGFVLEDEGKTFVVVPGPPREVENILEKHLKGLEKTEKLELVNINTSGIGESSLEDRLRKLDLPKNIRVNTYFGSYGVDIKLIGENKDLDDLNKAIELLNEEFYEEIYAIDSPSLPLTLLNKLNKDEKTLAFAESCTGGYIASSYTENPGASESLKVSLVTYSEEAKMKELGVKAETLEKYTAVSPQVAEEMLKGLVERYEADYYAITTGYASPPENEELNGLVYIGIYDKKNDKFEITENKYRGSRKQIIQRATNTVFFKILKLNK